MNMQIPKHMRAPLLIAAIAAIAAIAFSTAAMSFVPGWLHASPEGTDAITSQEQSAATLADALVPSGAGKTRMKARCDECGVIESTRRVAPAGNSPAIYEITVRLGDGSTHVLSDTTPASWRPGERITLIGGTTQSGR